MRLEELLLDGFGHFHQRTIGPIARAVTVFYGPNEAGKSTLLAFIRTILFGFPARGRNEHYPPSSGGRHGGRIRLSDDDGAIYTLERYTGTRGGPATVLTEAGETLDAETTLRRLTGQATPDLFNNVFAFSIDELQEVKTLTDSSVSGIIYSAGQGAPRLPALTRLLAERRAEIFRTSGSAQKIPQVLRELQDVEQKLRIVEDNANRYRSLTGRVEEIRLETEAADAALSQLNARSGEIRSLLSGWDDWVALSDCEVRLRDMPRFEQFPEDPIVRLEGLGERVQQAKEDLEDTVEQLQKASQTASAAIPGENLLNDAGNIEGILLDRRRFDESVRDLPDRQAELDTAESTLSARLSDLGQGWSESRLENFDTSIVFLQEIERHKETLAAQSNDLRQSQQRLEQEKERLTERHTTVREAQANLPTDQPLIDAAGLEQQRQTLRAARGRLNEYERARINHENLRGQLNSLTGNQESPDSAAGRPFLLLSALLALAGAVLIVASVFLSEDALPLGLVGGLALLGVAGYLLVQRHSAPTAAATTAANPLFDILAQQTATAEAFAESARQLLVEVVQPLAIDVHLINTAELDNADARLDSTATTLSQWNKANDQAQEAQRLLKSQEQRAEMVTQQLEAVTVSEGKARQEWQSWLEQHGLSGSFTPDTVIEFKGRVETTRARLEQVREMRHRVRAIEQDIDEFRAQVEPLAVRHDLPLHPDDRRQLASVADELIKRLKEAEASLSDREKAREQKEENQQRLDRQEQRLQSAQQDLANLLEAGGTDDSEEFRRRARQHQERLELEWQRDGHRRSLERLSGPGDLFDAFRNLLDASDPNLLNEESRQLSERAKEVDTQSNELRKEWGGIGTELRQLIGEEESSALRIQRNTMLEQLREHAREWSRLTIAELLLEKTRQKFERERQPSVIRHAQGFFSNVTGQRYQRLYAPIGEQTITVMDSTGASKQPDALSRGTREQLYLALRFGLIREFGEHAERLPVVVDEALVNFDPERARLAAESFAVLSQTNQVLVFTCHPATRDAFKEAAGAQVLDISQLAS